MNEPADARRSGSPVLPTQVGIHDFNGRIKRNRGWQGATRHDGKGKNRASITVVIVARRPSSIFCNFQRCAANLYRWFCNRAGISRGPIKARSAQS